jgi:hypothetical protein
MFLLMVAAAVAFGATDSSWSKVRDLKTGGEIRVYKKSAKRPVSAIFDQATDESLIVMIKDEETSIPKDEIDRIDYRAPKPGRIKKENRTKINDLDLAAPRVRGAAPMPTTSTSSGITFSGKGDFETVYRSK